MNQIDADRPASPLSLWILKTMLWILGVSALIPGLEMILDPSGKAVQFPEGYLKDAPFPNYFIPGVLLTLLIGIWSLLAAWALWKKPPHPFFHRINPFPQRHGAWTLALFSGINLIIWIIVQMNMVPYFFLQPTLLVWGVIIVLLCLSPGVQACYAIEKEEI